MFLGGDGWGKVVFAFDAGIVVPDKPPDKFRWDAGAEEEGDGGGAQGVKGFVGEGVCAGSAGG